MINIEKIEKQAQDLQACINNYKSAKTWNDEVWSRTIIDHEEAHESNCILDKCENTLKTQLRIMADDNREEIK